MSRIHLTLKLNNGNWRQRLIVAVFNLISWLAYRLIGHNDRYLRFIKEQAKKAVQLCKKF